MLSKFDKILVIFLLLFAITRYVFTPAFISYESLGKTGVRVLIGFEIFAVLFLFRLLLFAIYHPLGNPRLKVFLSIFTFFAYLSVFSDLYFALHLLQPDAFKNLNTPNDALYFSVITAATVGYGDITPENSYSRFLVIAQVILMYIFSVAVISVAVSYFVGEKSDATLKNIDRKIDKFLEDFEDKTGSIDRQVGNLESKLRNIQYTLDQSRKAHTTKKSDTLIARLRRVDADEESSSQ